MGSVLDAGREGTGPEEPAGADRGEASGWATVDHIVQVNPLGFSAWFWLSARIVLVLSEAVLVLVLDPPAW